VLLGTTPRHKDVEEVFENIEQRDDAFHGIYLAAKAK
jgi:hypothetical protein